MPPSGSTFTDWQRVESERSLFVEDFSWSDAPARRRRVSIESAPARQRNREVARVYAEDPPDGRRDQARSSQRQHGEQLALPTERLEPRGDQLHQEAQHTDAEFEEARRQWSAAYQGLGAEAFDRDDAASYASARVMEDRSGALDLHHSGRRTVIITGRGDSRYMLASARRRSSELRFHERTGFNPDRIAMWAVLLGIALLIGAVAH